VHAHHTDVIDAPHAGAAVAYCTTCTWLRLAPTADQAAVEAAIHTTTQPAEPAAEPLPIPEAA